MASRSMAASRRGAWPAPGRRRTLAPSRRRVSSLAAAGDGMRPSSSDASTRTGVRTLDQSRPFTSPARSSRVRMRKARVACGSAAGSWPSMGSSSAMRSAISRGCLKPPRPGSMPAPATADTAAFDTVRAERRSQEGTQPGRGASPSSSARRSTRRSGLLRRTDKAKGSTLYAGAGSASSTLATAGQGEAPTQDAGFTSTAATTPGGPASPPRWSTSNVSTPPKDSPTSTTRLPVAWRRSSSSSTTSCSADPGVRSPGPARSTRTSKRIERARSCLDKV
mmetsp:Transcript_11490/g.30994  ORF Transcript_11490/g.30994 Transcript_11490/m.30994 type:complete len:279 (-) Transcript_11490:571-1407(-)